MVSQPWLQLYPQGLRYAVRGRAAAVRQARSNLRSTTPDPLDRRGQQLALAYCRGVPYRRAEPHARLHNHPEANNRLSVGTGYLARRARTFFVAWVLVALHGQAQRQRTYRGAPDGPLDGWAARQAADAEAWLQGTSSGYLMSLTEVQTAWTK